MTNYQKTSHLPADLYEYLVAHGTPPDEIQKGLIERTRKIGERSIMQIPPEQGAFLTLLTRLIGARRAIEVGTFTGYSALCLARGLPGDGYLLCCDVSDEWTSIGRPFWEQAGVSEKIDLQIGPAMETLCSLPVERNFDIAFIDADKQNQLSYYEELLKRIRPGGVILVDNTLMFGRVVDPECDSELVQAVRKQNDTLAKDPRVECVMLPIADGLTLLRVL